MNKTEIFPARHEKLGRFALGRKSKRKAKVVAQGFRYTPDQVLPSKIQSGTFSRKRGMIDCNPSIRLRSLRVIFCLAENENRSLSGPYNHEKSGRQPLFRRFLFSFIIRTVHYSQPTRVVNRRRNPQATSKNDEASDPPQREFPRQSVRGRAVGDRAQQADPRASGLA